MVKTMLQLTLGCFPYNLNDYWDRKLLRNIVTSLVLFTCLHTVTSWDSCCNALYLWDFALFFKLLLTWNWAFSNWQLWFFPSFGRRKHCVDLLSLLPSALNLSSVMKWEQIVHHIPRAGLYKRELLWSCGHSHSSSKWPLLWAALMCSKYWSALAWMFPMSLSRAYTRKLKSKTKKYVMHNWKNKPRYLLLIKDGFLRIIRSLVSLSNCSVMKTSGSEQQRQTSLTWRTCAEHCFMACFLMSVY